MEVDGVVGILQRVAGEHQHHGFGVADGALRAQLLEPSESNSGSRLAAQAFGSQLRFCYRNLGFRYIEHQPPVS